MDERKRAILAAWRAAANSAATTDRLAALIDVAGPVTAWRHAQADGRWGVEMCEIHGARPSYITVTPIRAARPEYDDEARAMRAARDMARIAGGYDISGRTTTHDIATCVLVAMRLRDALSGRIRVTEHPRDRLVRHLAARGPMSVWRARRYRGGSRWYRGAVDMHFASLVDHEPVIGPAADIHVVADLATHVAFSAACDMARQHGGVAYDGAVSPGEPITDLAAARMAAQI